MVKIDSGVMSISQEKLNGFQARMGNWVASQGVVFQLRYAGGVRGGQSLLGLWLFRIGLRVLLLLMLAVLVFWVYLIKRVDFFSFREEVERSVVRSFGVEEAKTGLIKRERGFLEVAKMDLVGGETSFFENMRIRGMSTRMGLFDGVLTKWDGKSLNLNELVVEVKTGAESAEIGKAMYGPLFKQSDKFKFAQIEVRDATIRWGYSEQTKGTIEESVIQAVRKEGGWIATVTGGTFSQNWLKGLQIEKMVIAILPTGVEIREAAFRKGDGLVTFTARIESGESRTSLEGNGTVRNLSLDSFLTSDVREYLGGTISGELELFGSPYAASGIEMAVDVTLEEGDRVELRDRLPLFQAISVVDRHRSYKNVRFTSGGFRMESGGGRARLKNISLHAKDIMELEGDFLARKPNREELEKMFGVEERDTVGGAEELGQPSTPEDEGKGESGTEEGDVEGNDELSLEKAGEAATDDEKEKEAADNPLRDAGRYGLAILNEELLGSRERPPVLEGKLRIGLNPKAFSKAPKLAERYPIDTETGLRWLDVPLSGIIFEIGEEQARDIYKRNE